MVKLREAQESDLNDLHQLGKNVPEFSVSNETINFWPSDILLNAIRSNDVLIIIAEDKGQIFGFIIVNCNKGLKKALIENVYVIPGKRNSGVGEKLLNKALSLLQENKYEYVSTLIPLNASSALKLYTNVGFVEGDTFQWLDKTLSSNFES